MKGIFLRQADPNIDFFLTYIVSQQENKLFIAISPPPWNVFWKRKILNPCQQLSAQEQCYNKPLYTMQWREKRKPITEIDLNVKLPNISYEQQKKNFKYVFNSLLQFKSVHRLA